MNYNTFLLKARRLIKKENLPFAKDFITLATNRLK
jgi:hypothetical protein